MKILGIDYGRRKIGLAVSEGKLAEPLKVIKIDDFNDGVEKVKKEAESIKAEKLIVGLSEGEMGEEQKQFAKKMGAETFDETLSTYDAQNFSIEAGIKRKKRKGMEDAYAAAIILQNYLDAF